MVGLFYKAVPVLADEDKIGGSAIFSRHPFRRRLLFCCCGALAFAAAAAPAAAAHHHPLLGAPLGPRAPVAPANINFFTEIVSLALSSLPLVAVVFSLPTPAGVYAVQRWC